MVFLRSQDKADRPGRKVLQFAPNHGWNVEAAVGPVEKKSLSGSAVVDDDSEASGDGNETLLQLLVRMAAAHGAGGYVIEVVHTPDLIRQVGQPLNERKIAAPVVDARKLKH
jgi:hypothetical protein